MQVGLRGPSVDDLYRMSRNNQGHRNRDVVTAMPLRRKRPRSAASASDRHGVVKIPVPQASPATASPQLATPTAGGSPGKSYILRSQSAASHRVPYAARRLPSAELNVQLTMPKDAGYFKSVASLPVDSIAAAAKLGWRNVFSTTDEDLREAMRGAQAKGRRPKSAVPLGRGHHSSRLQHAMPPDIRIELEAQQNRVEALWEELKVPSADRAIFRGQHFFNHTTESSYDVSRAQQALMVEILTLLKHRQCTVAVVRAIEERERCLGYLSALCRRFGNRRHEFVCPDRGKAQRYALVQCVALARDATLVVVEAVRRWRRQLWRHRPFMWRADAGARPANYMVKISSDAASLLDTDNGAYLLTALGLSISDVPLLVPKALERVASGVVIDTAVRMRYLPVLMTHTFENEPDADFTSPRLAMRQRRAVRALFAEGQTEFDVRMEAERLRAQGRYIPLLRPLPLSKLYTREVNQAIVGQERMSTARGGTAHTGPEAGMQGGDASVERAGRGRGSQEAPGPAVDVDEPLDGEGLEGHDLRSQVSAHPHHSVLEDFNISDSSSDDEACSYPSHVTPASTPARSTAAGGTVEPAGTQDTGSHAPTRHIPSTDLRSPGGRAKKDGHAVASPLRMGVVSPTGGCAGGMDAFTSADSTDNRSQRSNPSKPSSKASPSASSDMASYAPKTHVRRRSSSSLDTRGLKPAVSPSRAATTHDAHVRETASSAVQDGRSVASEGRARAPRSPAAAAAPGSQRGVATAPSHDALSVDVAEDASHHSAAGGGGQPNDLYISPTVLSPLSLGSAGQPYAFDATGLEPLIFVQTTASYADGGVAAEAMDPISPLSTISASTQRSVYSSGFEEDEGRDGESQRTLAGHHVKAATVDLHNLQSLSPKSQLGRSVKLDLHHGIATPVSPGSVCHSSRSTKSNKSAVSARSTAKSVKSVKSAASMASSMRSGAKSVKSVKSEHSVKSGSKSVASPVKSPKTKSASTAKQRAVKHTASAKGEHASGDDADDEGAVEAHGGGGDGGGDGGGAVEHALHQRDMTHGPSLYNIPLDSTSPNGQGTQATAPQGAQLPYGPSIYNIDTKSSSASLQHPGGMVHGPSLYDIPFSPTATGAGVVSPTSSHPSGKDTDGADEVVSVEEVDDVLKSPKSVRSARALASEVSEVDEEGKVPRSGVAGAPGRGGEAEAVARDIERASGMTSPPSHQQQQTKTSGDLKTSDAGPLLQQQQQQQQKGILSKTIEGKKPRSRSPIKHLGFLVCCTGIDDVADHDVSTRTP